MRFAYCVTHIIIVPFVKMISLKEFFVHCMGVIVNFEWDIIMESLYFQYDMVDWNVLSFFTHI